jgi:hypothetical protein
MSKLSFLQFIIVLLYLMLILVKNSLFFIFLITLNHYFCENAKFNFDYSQREQK